MAECLLCSGPLGREVFPFSTRYGGKLFTYRACTRCGSSTLDPLPGPDDLQRMYARENYHAEHYAETSDEATDSRFVELLPIVEPERRTLLDFGCGNGNFLRLATRLGFEATGTELDPAACLAAAANSGRPVPSFSELQKSAQTFDIIRLGDVLEHLPEPAGTMRQLAGLLASGGVFVIEGPIEANAGLVRLATVGFGTLRGVLGRRREGAFPPFHLFQATRQAQHDFFRVRLGHDVRHFEVWETGWPYRQNPVPPTLSGRTRDVIGRLAVTAAALTRQWDWQLGNRFVSVSAPR